LLNATANQLLFLEKLMTPITNRSTLAACAVAALAVLSGCAAQAPAPAATPAAAPAAARALAAPAAAAASAEVFTIVAYAPGQSLSTTKQEPLQVSYSEKKGDAVVQSVAVANGAATIKGQLGTVRGSSWAGLGMIFNHGVEPAAQNLSAYKTVKITVASPTASSLRVRLSGSDQKTLDQGCYPVFFLQGVTATPKEFSIPIARFEPEQWCGENARRVSATITQVSGMEVVDIAQTNKPTEISVSKIELIK
jgi:hypothetical protein